MNIISSTVPPADHPASAPTSLLPGKREQGEGRAPESHSVFLPENASLSAGNLGCKGLKATNHTLK